MQLAGAADDGGEELEGGAAALHCQQVNGNGMIFVAMVHMYMISRKLT